MMRWPAEQQPLAPLFDPEVGSRSGGYIPCGICSVRTSMTNWAVCPHRLLSFDTAKPSEEQLPLRNRVLQLAGFGEGDTVRVWSEVTLRDSTGFNYIGRQTGLRLDELYSPNWQTDEVNVVSASIDSPQNIRLYSGPIHSNRGEACWTELLSTTSVPEVKSLTNRLTDDRVIATLKV